MRQLVYALPPAEREVIQRHHFCEQSLAEAAVAIGRDASWASRRHTRAVAMSGDGLLERSAGE